MYVGFSVHRYGLSTIIEHTRPCRCIVEHHHKKFVHALSKPCYVVCLKANGVGVEVPLYDESNYAIL